MKKIDLINLLNDFPDDAQIDVFVQDHFGGFDSATLAHVRKCPFVKGNLRLICDMDMGLNGQGNKGYAKITFRKG